MSTFVLKQCFCGKEIGGPKLELVVHVDGRLLDVVEAHDDDQVHGRSQTEADHVPILLPENHDHLVQRLIQTSEVRNVTCGR